MTGVCFNAEKRGWQQDQWSWLFSNFGITDVWMRGRDAQTQDIYQDTIDIESAADLPMDHKVIVLSPPDARFVKGNTSLIDFEHPEKAIYLFGASFGVISDDDLGGRRPDATVFIPTFKHELFAHNAGYIALYDRLVKRGGAHG